MSPFVRGRLCRRLQNGYKSDTWVDSAVENIGAAYGSMIAGGPQSDGLFRYVRPLGALGVAVPIFVLALVQGGSWIGSTFPGFFLMDNAVIPTVSAYDWPADKAALFHSRVRAVDGVPVESSAEVYNIVASRPAGAAFRFELTKDGRTEARSLASRIFTVGDFVQTYAVLLLFGLISLGAGITVGFLQPSTRQARVYHWQAVIVGLYAITGTLLYQGGWTAFTTLYLVLESCVGATFMHLAVRFPVERELGSWRKVLLTGMYALAAVQTILVLYGFYAEPPDLAAVRRNYLINAASFVFFLASLAFAYWENAEPVARARVKALLPGIFFGTLIMFYAFVDNATAGGDFPMQFGVVFVPVLYVSVAWAIARHDLFDIDRIVRQSFVYATLSAIVVAAYALVLSATASLFPGLPERHSSVVSVSFVMLIALLIDPLRAAVQRVIDAAFYRTRLDYSATISRLSDVLATILDVREIVHQVTRVLVDSMHLERVAVCFFDADGNGQLWLEEKGRPLEAAPADAALRRLADSLGPKAGLWTVDDPGMLAGQPEVLARITELGVGAALPLAVGGRTMGVLLLGRRRSGKPFDAQDAVLLNTLARQTAIAMQNALSYHALEELTRTLDERVQRQTQELRTSHAALEKAYADLKNAQGQLVQSEKLASLGQLVAGVAHELNNPASFVQGSMDNLKEFFAEYVTALERYRKVVQDAGLSERAANLPSGQDLEFLARETPELLSACAEGSERIKQIVDDLRMFARVDRGGVVVFDVRSGLDSTLRLLQPRLTQAGIKLVRQYDASLFVRASPGRLNQVWMNLLANAIDAVEGRRDPTIHVRTDIAGDHVEVIVADNGRGIPSEHSERVFEPFFTTKSVGAGTGLGLSIAYGVVRELDGTIEIDSAPEKGTTVRILLPAVAAAPAIAGDEAV